MIATFVLTHCNVVSPVSHIDRKAIKDGFFQTMAKEAEAKGLITLTSAEDRERSWRQILETNPNPDGRVWIFAYGSLLWNPAFHLVDQSDAFLDGYHRDFCLRTYIGRGDEHQPGLVLGLEPGGCCHGKALQVDPSCIEEELDVLWSREMLASAYHPRWLPVATGNQTTVHAVVFLMDTDYCHYAGPMSFEERCHDLAHGVGALGAAADYLFDTVKALESMNICDALLEKYVAQVRAIQAGAIQTGNTR